MEFTELVINTLNKAGVPMKASEIAVAAGIEKNDVDKAIKKLQKEEKIFSPQRCFFDIKK